LAVLLEATAVRDLGNGDPGGDDSVASLPGDCGGGEGTRTAMGDVGRDFSEIDLETVDLRSGDRLPSLSPSCGDDGPSCLSPAVCATLCADPLGDSRGREYRLAEK
jgi:hypothetical protein